MKHRFKGWVALCLLLAGPAAEAAAVRSWRAYRGGWSSGGGNVVVCFDSEEVASRVRRNRALGTGDASRIVSIESVDLAEARLRRGIPARAPRIIEIGAGESELSYVARVRERFAGSVPTVATLIDSGRRAFPDERVLYSDAPLPFADDAALDFRADEGDCALLTAMRQMQTEQTDVLWVDAGLFEHPKHGALSRAVLFLHEFVYREARKLGQKDSRNTRLLVGRLVAEREGTPETALELIRFGKALGFLRGDLTDTYAYRLLVDTAYEQMGRARQIMAEFEQARAGDRRRIRELLKTALPDLELRGPEELGAIPELYDRNTDWARFVKRTNLPLIEKVQAGLYELTADLENELEDRLRPELLRWWDRVQADSRFSAGVRAYLLQAAEGGMEDFIAAIWNRFMIRQGCGSSSCDRIEATGGMDLASLAIGSLERGGRRRYVDFALYMPAGSIEDLGRGSPTHCRVTTERGARLDVHCLFNLTEWENAIPEIVEEVLPQLTDFAVPGAPPYEPSRYRL